MNLRQKLSLELLSETKVIRPFDCGDHDLNSFLLNESKNFKKNLLATTYIVQTPKFTVGYFSLLNDKVSKKESQSNRKWKQKFTESMPQGKQFKSYPAVKIGRLAVDVKMNGEGLGSLMIQYVKETFRKSQKSGCKFITVDAYRDSLKFYEKNGFEYLTKNDEGANTRLMYFDLTVI
ncbi:MAG: GNAT family N-acetyltransferase [Bacteroidetes bacterium]|nr:MAG: GNAT family N-acetyltransferase [Bacteroidota bacterium]